MVPNWEKAISLSHGKFVWLLGSDDVLKENSINLMLNVIKSNEDIALISCNCIHWMPENKNYTLTEVLKIDEEPRSKNIATYRVPKVKELISIREDAFTPIYCNIMSKNDWLNAIKEYRKDKPFFSCIENTVPHAYYIAQNMFNKPGYYIGEPLVLTSTNISWKKHLPFYLTQIIPTLYDTWLKNGADPTIIKAYKKQYFNDYHKRNVIRLLKGKLDGAKYFSFIKYLRQFYGIYKFKDIFLYLKEYCSIDIPHHVLQLRIFLSKVKKALIS